MEKSYSTISSIRGFTLIELIIVIVIIGILATVAAPRFIDISTDARISALNKVASEMKSTITLVKSKAIVSGLRAAASNPAGGSSSNQIGYAVDFGFGNTEVDWRNLCPEAEAEVNDALGMLDFVNYEANDFQVRTDNQYALLGFEVPSSGIPTNQGCYIIYDSFGSPECTITVVTTDC